MSSSVVPISKRNYPIDVLTARKYTQSLRRKHPREKKSNQNEVFTSAVSRLRISQHKPHPPKKRLPKVLRPLNLSQVKRQRIRSNKLAREELLRKERIKNSLRGTIKDSKKNRKKEKKIKCELSIYSKGCSFNRRLKHKRKLAMKKENDNKSIKQKHSTRNKKSKPSHLNLIKKSRRQIMEDKTKNSGRSSNLDRRKSEVVTSTKPNDPIYSVLSRAWYEVQFLLRKKINNQQDLEQIRNDALQGIEFLNRLDRYARSLNIRKGALSQQLLPFSNETSVVDQANYTRSPENGNEQSRLEVETREQLTNSAINLRKLIRVKLADDADLDQAMQAVCRLRDFFIHLYHHAPKRNLEPFEMLNQLCQ